MSLLSPPAVADRPALRSRASSTSVRPQLSVQSLSPRNRAASLSIVPPSPSHTNKSAIYPSPTSSCDSDHSTVVQIDNSPSDRNSIKQSSSASMVPLLISRVIQLVRALRPGASPKDTAALFVSPPASPRSSTDTEFILPVSSPRKTAFDVVDVSVPVPRVRFGMTLRVPSVHAPVLFVILSFPLSTGLTLFCLSTLPVTAAWPRTLADLAKVGQDLNAYAQSGTWQTLHILAVLSVSAVWKHAFSIPGSVLWNVLAGALFHPIFATIVMTALTTIGSILSTILSAPLAPILTRFFPRPIELTRSALEGSSSSSALSSSLTSYSSEIKPTNLGASSSRSASKNSASPAWVRLSVLRLVGVVPWSALNIACGLTGVSLRDCAAGAFIGTLPWTAVTCQIGDILQTVGTVHTTGLDGVEGGEQATLSSLLASPQIILELVFLSVLSLAPILGRDYLRRFLSSSDPQLPSRKNSTDIESEGDGDLNMDLELDLVETATADEYSKEVDQLLTSENNSDVRFHSKEEERGRRQQRRQRWRWDRISLSVPRWSALHSPRAMPDEITVR